MSIDLKVHKAVKGNVFRLIRCLFHQKSSTRSCPEFPHLEGKNVLITGGTAGIGEFISRGLSKRGAHVVSLSRGMSQPCAEIANVQSIRCDLSENQSVADAVDQLTGKKFDILICNSGIMLNKRENTSAGIEKTFAVNVLGHHLLYRLLLERGMFADNARIVLTTGEANLLPGDCESNPKKYSLTRIYGGSKLGNLWQAQELTKRYPSINAYAVNPGTVLSGIGEFSDKGFIFWLRNKILISKEQGAQSALIAATQDLPRGSYWDNIMGIIELYEGHVGKDARKSTELWNELEKLSAPWLDNFKMKTKQ